MARIVAVMILGCMVAACISRVERVNDEAIASYTAQTGTVVLNFWATWCEPCVEEIPVFIRLQKQAPDVQIIGISLDELGEEQQVREFVRKHHINYRIVLRDGENFETMVNSIDPAWIGALPATFVFKNGKRVFSKAGLINEQDLMQAVHK